MSHIHPDQLEEHDVFDLGPHQVGAVTLNREAGKCEAERAVTTEGGELVIVEAHPCGHPETALVTVYETNDFVNRRDPQATGAAA